MGSPCEPLTARQELISDLEGLGYDTMPGTRADWSDWRERLSDDELRTAIRNITDPARRDSAPAWQDGTGTAGDGDAINLPDVAEMVDVMRRVVDCADAWIAANLPHEGASPEWDALDVAFTSLRDMVARIDRACDLIFGGTAAAAEQREVCDVR